MDDCAFYLVSNISDMNPSWCSITPSPSLHKPAAAGAGRKPRVECQQIQVSTQIHRVLTLKLPTQGLVEGLHIPI